jgi:hypothetical protein
MPQDKRPTGPPGQAISLFQDQPGHAAAHRAAADQGNAERFCHEVNSIHVV